MNERYHVLIGNKRTTVSIPPLMVQLLCLKEGIDPGGPKAHAHVKHVLQGILDRFPDDGRVHVSQFLKDEIVLSLINKKLSKQYDNWILS